MPRAVENDDDLNEYDDCDGFEEDYDSAEDNCHGHFENGTFWCGKAGSEECDDDCPYSDWIGLTRRQIEDSQDDF